MQQGWVPYLAYLSVGIKATVLVWAISFFAAVALAFVSGLIRTQRIPVLKWIALTYVEIFRGTSLLVQLFWLYFSLPLIGITIPPITAACLGLALNSGAYGSEIVRGALASVPKDQIEASIALNLTSTRTLWRVLLPQAVVEMVPAFGNLAILVLKDTALVSMISIVDVAFRAQQLRTFTHDSARIYLLALLIYFVLALVISFLGKRVEAYVRPVYLRPKRTVMGLLR